MNSVTDFPVNDAAAFLTQTEFFAGIDPELLAQVTRDIQSRRFQTDQVVCGVGEPAKQVFVVVSGLIKRALMAESGQESVADLVAPGQTFGETELFSRRPFAISAVAVEPTVILCLDGELVRKAAESDTRFGSHMISLMASGRLSSESERAVSPTRSSGERVLDYLVDLADKNQAAGWGSTIKLATTKQLIAARIGLTPETFSRALRQLSVEGKILVDRRHVTLRESVTSDRRPAAVNAPQAQALSFKFSTEGKPGCAINANIHAPAGLRQRPNLATINVAGRQRMLSQQISKFWLMIQYGISARHARTMMQRAIATFEQQMTNLGELESNDDIAQSLAALRSAWHPYHTQLKSVGVAHAKKVLELGESVLQAAHKLTMNYVSYVNDNNAQLVNLAGRQRMLSQQIAKLYLLQQGGSGAQDSAARIRCAREEFSAALRQLMQSSRDNPLLKQRLRSVSDQWSAMTDGLDHLSADDASKAASQVSLCSERVVRQLDNVVDFYALAKKAA